MDVERRVVEALMRLGPKYTEISRLTGIPISTVRYILTEKLAKLGLSIRPAVDYNLLGLRDYLTVLRFTIPAHHAVSFLDLLGSLMYLDYYAYLLKSKKFLAMFSVPSHSESSFIQFLEELRNFNILSDYHIKRLQFRKILPFRADCFDFRNGVWMQDWDRREGRLNLSLDVDKPVDEIKFTSLDLRILSEFQRNPFVKYVYLAKRLGVSRQTIKRHISRIIKTVYLYAISWFPKENPELIATPLIINSNSSINVRRAVLKVPFSFLEMGSDDGEYYAMLFLPSIGFYKTMKYLGENLELEWLDFPSMEMAGAFRIHYKLYKDGVGWINTFEKGIEKILKEVKTLSK